MFFQLASKFRMSVIRSLTVGMVLTIFAQPTCGQTMNWWHNVAGTVPIDTKRHFTSFSDQVGSGLTAKLNSHFGFATGFAVSLAPYELLGTIHGNVTHRAFRVWIDMNNDGIWELEVLVPGPNDSAFSESFAVAATWNYQEPVYPAMDDTNVIRWLIEEKRVGPNGLVLGDVVRVAGTVSITTLATPNDFYVDPFPPSPEPSSLSGYLSPDGIRDRPVIVVEGVDVTNTAYPSSFLGRFLHRPNGTGSSMVDALLTGGYDVYVYNYGDAKLSMRDNAMNLLGAILSLKDDFGASGQRTRVLGISMGGVVTRYALAWAEANGIDHGCDMFISLDAPQQGAWINLDFMGWLDSVDPPNSTTTEFINQLATPSALELLRNNRFEPVEGATPGSTQEDFLAEINDLNGDGYPHLTRNIGISNGQGDIGDIANIPLPGALGGNTSLVGASIADITVNGLPLRNIAFQKEDIWGGSKQPAFRPQTIQTFETLWDGMVGVLKIRDAIQLKFVVTLGPWGAPTFMPVNTALDLQGVVRTGIEHEQILNWESTKFDEIYMDPLEQHWHDELPDALAPIVIAQLLEGPQFVYPSLITPIVDDYYERKNVLHISWENAGLQSNMPIKLFVRPVGGTWVEIHSAWSYGPSDFFDWTVDEPDGQYEIKLETDHPDAVLESAITNGPFTIATQTMLAPVAGQVHPSGSDLNVQWVLHPDASSVDIAYSPDGGQSFTNFLGLPNDPCPNDPLNGCYTLPGLNGVSSQSRIEITSHYPYGAIGTQSSGDFTVWDIDDASVQPTVTTSCPNTAVNITVSWATTVATDGSDQLELYRPSVGPCSGVPTHVRTAASSGTTHQVSYSGACSIGTWACVVKSTKSSGETESTCHFFTVNDCPSCSSCNPPCELN